MKRIKYLALAALVGVWACSSDTTTPEITGSISGTVTIEGTGASGITVTLSSGASTTTGSDGSYSFSGVAGGAYTVTISDYPADVTFSSTSKAAAIQTAGQSVPVDFSGSYIRTASIVGAVTAGGTGIAGVSVAAAGPGGTQNKVTDANGNFTFSGLRAGSYTLTISDVPSGYTFATTSKTVTVAVGSTENAQFTGTKDQDEVTASVVIQSVKTPAGTSVNPSAVVGQIDITLQIDPGTNQLSKVCVLLDDAEVPNGCQTLSSAVASAEDLPMAADGTLTATFSILTAAFDATSGAPSYMNGNHTLAARLDLTNATQASVETSMDLTFANTDMIVAEVSPEFSAVGSLAPNSGKLFYGGDQTVNLTPVLYSGKTLASASVQFTGNATSKTATTFPGSVKFTNDPASGSTPAGPLFDYQSGAPDVDQFKVSAALYSDGTSATALVGTVATGPNGTTHTIDEKPPTAVALNLTDQVAGALDGTACCANNWVGPDYMFEDGLAADPADQAGGVGVSTTQFFVGAATAKQADVIAGTAVETAGDAGLALSFVNTENTVYAVFVDKVNNKTVVKLSGAGANTLTTFGFDNTMPTAFKATAASVPDKIIYNIANAGGVGSLAFSQTEDRAGFSSVPISAYIVRYDPEDDPSPYYAVAQDTEDGGAINIGSTLAACGIGVDPTAAAPCYPNNNLVTNGLWMVDAAGQDQAGNRTETHVQRMLLVDNDAPLTQNVSLPPQLVAGSSVTYSAPVTDKHELWSVAFGQDFGNDGIYIPFGENVMVGDGNRWDTNFVTSATATLTLPKAVVAREYAPAGAPAGAFTYTTNVQAVTTDAAGNQSAPIGNNFIPGTVDPTGKAAIFGTTTNWEVSGPDAATDLCNGQGGTACDVAPDGTDVESVDMEIIAQGATGTYANPFGADGVIYVYVFTGGQYYLLGSVGAASAALTDDGVTRTYTWTFTVTKDDVAFIGDGTNIGLVAIGLNAVTGTVLQSDANTFVTVVNGS